MSEHTEDFGVRDSVSLVLTVLVSSLPYIFRIGFYSDDWGYLPAVVNNSHQGTLTMFRYYLALDPSIRPVPLAYVVLSAKVFGLHPLPYHIFNTVVLALVVVALYFVLIELRAGRLTAFSIALVFGLLPHYSTDRVWISAHQVTLSMLFALLGMCALLRATRAGGRRSLTWVVLAVFSLLLSILSYEVALGLIVGSLLFIGMRAWRARRTEARATSPINQLWPIAVVTFVLLLAGIIKILKQTRIAYHHNFFKHLAELAWHAIVQLIQFNLWTYLLDLPEVLRGLYRNAAINRSTVSVASLLSVSVTAYLWKKMGALEIPSRRFCVGLLLAGAILFGLGYGLFFADINADFSSMGITNRFVMASALGPACFLVGITGLLSSLLRSPGRRNRAFTIAIAIICGVNCLVMNGIEHFWADASARQGVILRDLATHIPQLPKKSVLLLDGFCRYSGPGVVFENDWDATGAVQLALNDPTLTADVISPNLTFGDSEVTTTMDGQPESRYPYADNLFVYNMRSGILKTLPSAEAARAYARAFNPALDSGCPPVRNGHGALLF